MQHQQGHIRIDTMRQSLRPGMTDCTSQIRRSLFAKIDTGRIVMTQRNLSRRTLIAGAAGLAGAAALTRAPLAQTPPPNAQLGTPPSTITNPPRDWSPGHPSIYPDPDVLAVDPSFRQFAPGN